MSETGDGIIVDRALGPPCRPAETGSHLLQGRGRPICPFVSATEKEQ